MSKPKKNRKRINPTESQVLDSRDNPPQPNVHTPVSLSFQHVKPGAKYCLSESQSKEVREVVDCLRIMTTMTWMQVQATGGKPGNKASLGYTVYDDKSLTGVTRPASVKPDARIAGVRASNKYRVFGYYSKHVFYILWFDREHAIVPV